MNKKCLLLCIFIGQDLLYMDTKNHDVILQQRVNRFSHQFHIRLPGSEIPKWFSCKSDGNRVAIELRPNWFNDEFMGIAMCGVYAPLNNGIRQMTFGVEMSMMRNTYAFLFSIPSFIAVESDHLCLFFVSRVMFEHPDYVLPKSNNYVSLIGSPCIHAEFFGSKSKVMKCGIRQVYKQDIEDFQEFSAAEGTTFHQNHSCSLPESSTTWSRFFMPTKLEYHCNIRRNYSGSGLDDPYRDRPEYSDSDEEPDLARKRRTSGTQRQRPGVFLGRLKKSR
ncbi:hypothetical protein Dsin_033131 [Dipteronia sinensis]|uniref:C-JID domain-containing protein n=1 Tax=Dipteronia sinensis TaxID=43782 RepID=A0AAD9Z8Q6_9ROSI|nr:hypothetical protein Dsin_033131 [Dipteronia sinensis]